MAELTKVIKSTEDTTRTIKNGETKYYSFEIPKSSNNKSVLLSIPVSTGTGIHSYTYHGQTISYNIGAVLDFYISYDNGKNYTRLPYVDFNAGESKTLEYNLEIGDYTKIKIKVESAKDYSGWTAPGMYSASKYPDSQLKRAKITLTSNVSEAKITNMIPSSGTFVIEPKKFTWAVQSPGTITETRFCYKKSTESTYHAVTLSKTATSYTFKPSAGEKTNYNWYVVAVDSWGNTIGGKSDAKTVTFGSTVTCSFKNTSTVWSKTGANTFYWDFNDSLDRTQKAIQYGYRVKDGTWRLGYNAQTTQSYTFRAGEFTKLPQGTYEIYIQVQNTDNIWSEPKTMTVTIGTVPTVKIVNPTSGTTWKTTEANTISWSWAGLTQQHYQVEYRPSNTDLWTTIEADSSATSYKFAKDTFIKQKYDFRVRAKNEDDLYSDWSSVSIQVGSIPSISVSVPSTIWRTQANTFSWTYSDTQSFTQTVYEIGFKLTSAATWTTITENSNNNYHVFSANYFSYAKYNGRIRVKNNDDAWSEYKTFDFQSGSIPTISINQPENKANLRRATANAFTWTLSDTLGTGQYSYEFRYREYNSTEWTTKAVISSESSYSIAANSLDAKTYAWQVRVQNNDRNWSGWTSERTFVYGSISTLTLVSPEDGSNVRLLAPLVISWSSTDTLEVGQKAYELQYKVNSSTEWSTLTGTTGTSRTIASGTLTHASYDFRIRIQNNDNVWTEYSYFTVRVGSEPTLSLAYPVDVNIKRDIAQDFLWNLEDSLNTGQNNYEIGYKKSSETEWTTTTETTSNLYKQFSANTFEAGEYNWRLKVTNNDGISTDYVYATFTIIGVTEAPVITNVTMSAIPTLTWTVDSQDTFEFELYNTKERIYASGIQKGADIRQYTPNIMIPDGNYTIKIRCMNEYGYFTEWMTYSFVLITEKPSAYDCYIYANEFHGVTVCRSLELDTVTPSDQTSQTTIPDTIFVLRRKSGANEEWSILGKLSTADETVKYVDNEPEKEVEYEYALRNYKGDAGYTDSDAHLIMLRYKGIIIYNGNDFVNLTLSENQEFDIQHTPSKTYTYSHMLGREYPVKESSEWLNMNTAFSCYATFEQYSKLKSFMDSNNQLWFKGTNISYACSIDSMSIKQTHLGKGYSITITLTRVNVDEVNLI